MTEFTRLTIVGALHKAEMVIPSDEALGGLIPRLMDLLGETTGSVARPLTLVRSTGEQLDIALSAAEQRLEDGELLRLVRQDDAPPPPEVADVTDVLADSHGDRVGLWSPTARHTVGAIGIGAFALAASLLAGESSLGSPATVVSAVLAAAIVVAAIVGRIGFRWGSIAFTALALGAAWPAATFLVAEIGVDPALQLIAAGGVALILGWVAVGLGVGIGTGNRPALWGSIVGAALTALPVVLLALGMGVLEAAAIAGIVAVVTCGILPWYAMSISGLTGLDDQVVEGRLRKRDDVLVTVNSAYRALNWSTVATAIPIAAASSILLASHNAWAIALGVSTVLVTALRTRAFPLSIQGVALWLAVATAIVLGAGAQSLLDPGFRALVFAGFITVVLVLVAARPARHQRASLRRLGNTLEALAVVSLFPFVLGVFGVYTDLLGAF